MVLFCRQRALNVHLYLAAGILIGAVVVYMHMLYVHSIPSIRSEKPVAHFLYSGGDFELQFQQVHRDLKNSLYYFDRPGRMLPLMKQTDAEKNREFRTASGREWLKSQGIVVAASVRNAMAGLPNSARNLKRLRSMFGASWMVFMENDSQDSTRPFLYSWTQADPSVILLGCGTLNSPDPCKLNIRYSTGKQHSPGWHIERNFQEQVDRGLVMNALRNVYLDFIYDNLAENASLLLILDPDLSWVDWDLDNIAQGLYYFMAKPQLQQLCSHATYGNNIYDPCTLQFLTYEHLGDHIKKRSTDYGKDIRDGPSDSPPVKVVSCFQAFSFYRMSELAARRLRYKKSPGEWLCEHKTLTRQLDEVYLDPQMRLTVRNPFVG